MLQFNQTITTGKTLAHDASALPRVNAWSTSPKQVLRRYPAFGPIVDTLRSMLSQKRFETLSISSQTFTKDSPTCVDTGWHVDGRMNPDNPDEYALICFGADGMRTLFHNQSMTADLPRYGNNSPGTRARTFSSILGHDLHDESFGF